MSYEAYRVRRRFGWRGWQLAPVGACTCQCRQSGDERCNVVAASGCVCEDAATCACGIPAREYAGDIWIVEAGHPRKDIMLANRFAVGDASIPAVDVLLQEERYSRMVLAPHEAERKREPVAAGRRK